MVWNSLVALYLARPVTLSFTRHLARKHLVWCHATNYSLTLHLAESSTSTGTTIRGCYCVSLESWTTFDTLSWTRVQVALSRLTNGWCQHAEEATRSRSMRRCGGVSIIICLTWTRNLSQHPAVGKREDGRDGEFDWFAIGSGQRDRDNRRCLHGFSLRGGVRGGGWGEKSSAPAPILFPSSLPPQKQFRYTASQAVQLFFANEIMPIASI